uniref:Uncharacterized protein LOC114344333 n=1 Tax=Diabrotica virgifera virgifera TaxID=50390 RepID=A0A6P7GZT0_DIAVI
MESESLNIPPDDDLPGTQIAAPFVFIGDDAYPLLRHLLKSYKGRDLTPEQEYFNMRLSRARRVVECAFGILSAKFRILRKPIETSPKLADKIIKCVCILHNIIMDKERINSREIGDVIYTLPSARNEGRGNRPANIAAFIRDVFKNYVNRHRM